MDNKEYSIKKAIYITALITEHIEAVIILTNSNDNVEEIEQFRIKIDNLHDEADSLHFSESEFSYFISKFHAYISLISNIILICDQEKPFTRNNRRIRTAIRHYKESKRTLIHEIGILRKNNKEVLK